MPLNRRKFLQLTAGSAFIISADKVLRPAQNIFPASALQSRFAIVSDGHYGQPGTDYEMHHDQMIQWLNAEKRGKGIDFTFINGDLFHNDHSFLTPVKNKWQGLSMPHYVSHGNHDQVSEQQWKDAWGLAWNYSFEHKDAGIVVLNTATEQGDYTCADAAITKKLLDQYAHKKHVLVFMHITPFKWTRGGISCPQISAMLEQQHNLKAVFHGHDHDEDDVKTNNGVNYFFDSHIAGDWGTQYHGYRIAEIYINGDILIYQVKGEDKTTMNKLMV